ncbi:hypothetical protein GCM10011348_25830 [Marinobacterium nitratireducens]|uniref:DnaT DNA-binding domain-containing protein n=1 Tax=Marinobacterium nitratireducens TaxID=518897 RepID=A0A918DUJ9_9GAMM|nr:DnaT-like ssDNA-binding domain-containing protein [Marinobacterium nitratireducens]GGO83038.1 hypothetical protein GCM10011348_25830 [Marinobacterium nitratireducens]
MGYTFPEQPIPFYPSLAKRLGSDEALLLAIYHDRARSGGRAEPGELLISRSQWLQLADFWDESRLAAATESLVRQGCLEASYDGNLVRLRLLPQTEAEAVAPPRPEPVAQAPAAEPLTRLPVHDEPPRPLTRQASRPRSQPRMIEERGPAPTFGAAGGWRRHKDELQVLFEQHEVRNQQLKPMELGWRPSETFFALLPRHQIPAEYAEELLDEFVLYWIAKERKETNWDQKFLTWVKREWVRKQSRDSGIKDAAARGDQAQQTGYQHENSRRDSREKRKQVTAAIMDIRDTDW